MEGYEWFVECCPLRHNCKVCTVLLKCVFTQKSFTVQELNDVGNVSESVCILSESKWKAIS